MPVLSPLGLCFLAVGGALSNSAKLLFTRRFIVSACLDFCPLSLRYHLRVLCSYKHDLSE